MKIVKIIAILGALAMSAVLLNGFINGSFFEDGSLLLNNPWGIVSLVDLYVGFILFSVWIWIRESSLITTLIWILLMMVFGFLTASIYLFYAVHTSENDLLKTMLGKYAKHYRKREDNDISRN